MLLSLSLYSYKTQAHLLPRTYDTHPRAHHVLVQDIPFVVRRQSTIYHDVIAKNHAGRFDRVANTRSPVPPIPIDMAATSPQAEKVEKKASKQVNDVKETEEVS